MLTEAHHHCSGTARGQQAFILQPGEQSILLRYGHAFSMMYVLLNKNI